LENKNFKNQKSTPQPRRKEMSLFTKLGLILLGIGLLLLIISFWSWYFTLLGISTTYAVPNMFLFAGGASLIAGLLLLIIRWVTA
jgi:polyferredoxin